MLKKILKITLAFIIVIILSMIWFIQSKINLYVAIPNQDIGIENANNLDNDIYKGGNEYEYTYTIKKDTTFYRLHAYIEYNYNKYPSFTSYKILPRYKKENKHEVDIIKMSVYKNETNFSIGKKQTVIEYSMLINNKKATFLNEYTGLIEDIEGVWLHPIRSLWFENLEYCPFPQIKYKREKWQDFLRIHGNDYPHPEINKMDFDYQIDTIEVNSIDTTYFISADGLLNGEKISRSSFEFSSEMGFQRLNFRTMEGYDVEFKIKK